MLPLVLGAADPVSAILSSSTFRSVGTMLLIGVIMLAMFAPTILEKIKKSVLAWVEERIGHGNTVDASKVVPPVGINVNVNEAVQQRANALKNACPQAPAELRLKWLENGYEPGSAQTDYIHVLETRLAETRKAEGTTPSTTPLT